MGKGRKDLLGNVYTFLKIQKVHVKTVLFSACKTYMEVISKY